MPEAKTGPVGELGLGNSERVWGDRILLCEAHKNRLLLHYGIDPERPEIKTLVESGQLRSVTSQEIEDLTGWKVDGSGLHIGYPGNEAFVIRPDNPPAGGPKYLHPKGEPNSLFIPPGFDISQAQDLWITEGELKALCGFLRGLPVVALGGVYNWRTSGPEAELLAEGEKLKDEEALLPELAQVNWSGKKVTLLYDSDITPGHKAYDAFPRLAEQLYRLGAEEVRILSLPSVAQGQKTGLDEFILARKEQALPDLQAMKDRKEPYLPIRDGALAYAERLVSSKNQDDKLKAATAYLSVKGEFITGDWLKENGLLGERRKALLHDAKLQLKELQRRPSKASSQTELSQDLGPEYDEVKRLLKATGYTLDEQGRLCREDFKTRTDAKGNEHIVILNIPLCNFSCWPIREILKDNGASQERHLELQGLLQGGTPLKPAKISLAEFLEKPTWAGLAWGAKAALRPNEEKEARYCVQQMAQGIPETVIYTHLGWREIDGEWVYLHAGGAVGSEAVEVEISDRLRKYIIPEDNGDIKKALKASLSLLGLGPKTITYSLLALVWLTPLCEPLRKAGIEPCFLTYLWGTSGAFKSTLIALFLSHYGDFGPKGLPASFRDTGNSVEEMAFQAKDSLLVVDDLYPAKNPRERTKLEGVLEYLLRNQGDRQGKGRLQSNSSLKPGHPPRGLILSSGEVMPLSGSSLARAWVNHIKEGDFSLEKLIPAQSQKALFSQGMKGYLEYLAPQLDTLPSHLFEDFEQLREQAKRASKIRTRHGRLDETVAFLFLGLHMFFNYAVAQEALTQEEAVKILQEAWDTFNQVADDLAQVAEREEPTKRFFEALLELQTLGRVYFATMEDALPEIAERTLGTQKIGWGPDDKRVYYLLYGPAWEAVTKYLRTQEETLSLSKNDLLDSMEKKKLLDRSQGNRRSIVKKIAGTQVRVLPLLEKAFTLEEENNEA